ncbi:MAG: homoserine dehydrogenase [Alphaproteobacteria bacterium]
MEKQPLRIGLAGLGTVGVAAIKILREQKDLLAARAGRDMRLVAVSARDRSRDRGVDLSGCRWHDDPASFAADPDIDVVVELMGGAGGAARNLVTAALKAGKSVVTANKALLAAHGVELAAITEQTGAALAFEAAVAGGVPVIKVLREAMAANRVTRIRGILNGTCNDILSRMAWENVDFDQALKAAQDAGYAEADPSQDIDGFDAMQKIALLAMIAGGGTVDLSRIEVAGIRDIVRHDVLQAKRDGMTIKLIAGAELSGGKARIRVKPEKLMASDPLAQLSGPTNVIELHGDFSGPIMLIGAGAGGSVTASAIVADLVDIACGRKTLPFGVPVAMLREIVVN